MATPKRFRTAHRIIFIAVILLLITQLCFLSDECATSRLYNHGLGNLKCREISLRTQQFTEWRLFVKGIDIP